MKIYLVGGAVRDRLMGRPVQDRDWVVVGGSPEELLAAGYQAVGGGFPVFLHPDTREEYALARTERRTGPGHRGFSTWYAPDVTLEDDLRRRDLTINAMAMDEAGQCVDPFGGRADLEARWLRATSPAFVEDPLRILRIARFAAQLPGFRVHPETVVLMREMMAANVLDELPAERVWRELDKAVNAPAPERFIEVLREIPAFHPWFEEWRTLQPPPSGGFRGAPLLALWCETMTVAGVRRLFDRMRTPHRVRDFVLHVQVAREPLSDWHVADAEDVLAVLERLHAFHPDSGMEDVMSFLERRHGLDLADLRAAAAAAGTVGASDFAGVAGRELGEAIRGKRIEIIRSCQRRR